MLSSFKTSEIDIEAMVKKNLNESIVELKDDIEELTKKTLDVEVSRIEADVNYRLEALEVRLSYRADEIEKKLMYEIEKQGWNLTMRMTGIFTAGLVLLETVHRIFPSLR